MKLWVFLFAATIVSALAISSSELIAAEKELSTKPNIVFILSDDQGYADTGFMGSTEIRTPHLDAIAKQGTVLESFYVQPVCSPTRASLMTGRYVSSTGVYHVVRPGAKWGLPLAERTLADALREAGYQTAISGKWHLGEYQPSYRPTHRGFEQQYGHWFGALDYFTHMRDGVLDWHRNDELCKDEGYSTKLIAEEACRVIREKDPAKPLFLYVPFNAVHSPHQVPDAYEQPFTDLKGVRRTYAGMVAAMDQGIGKIVATLKEQGLSENTLIIFSSDNGGPSPGKVTSNGPLRAGKGTIYEGGIRVCAFASWPGHIPAGQRNQEPIHIVDWYPTLLKLAGGSLEQKHPLDGRDIWPVLTSGAKSPHESLFLPGMDTDQAAIRQGDWKLLLNASKPGAKQTAASPQADGIELYNLSTDLGESKNVANEHPEVVKELQALLNRHIEASVPRGDIRTEAVGNPTDAPPQTTPPPRRRKKAKQSP
ncbi:MAG: arylsulfatase [Planctomycetaceae bacterium]